MASINNAAYQRRREKLKQQMGSGLLLFLGNGEVGMNYADNTYHFRQDSSLLYFFGLDYPDLAAVIDIDEPRPPAPSPRWRRAWWPPR